MSLTEIFNYSLFKIFEIFALKKLSQRFPLSMKVKKRLKGTVNVIL